MAQAKHLTIDLDERDYADLAAIAAFEEQSLPEMAAQTLHTRIERHREFVAAVEEGLAAARAGETVSHETILEDIQERRRKRVERMARI